MCPSVLSSLLLKVLFSFYGQIFSRKNISTFSGNLNCISIFLCHLNLCQTFWAKPFVKETDNCFGWSAKVMAYLDTIFMNFNIYFPQYFFTFILQIPLFYTRWDIVNSCIIRTPILFHFTSSYIGTFRLGSVLTLFFKLMFSSCKASIMSLFRSERLVLIAAISSLRDSIALSNSLFLNILTIRKWTVNSD